MNNIIYKSEESLNEIYFQYTHLKIGGKEIVCPYWMNNLEKGIYGPIGGKGRPQEIANETEKEAIKENIDLNKLSEEGITLFMRAKKIGVDCSGFVFWMLDNFDRTRGGDGIANDIPGSQGKFIKVRASVKMLTDEKVSTFIENISQIKIGDMVRVRRGKHVLIIISLGYENDILKEIEYAHSTGSGYSKISGVHKSKIIVSNLDEPIWKQTWLEQTSQDKSYSENIYPEDGDGIFRLKNFQ